MLKNIKNQKSKKLLNLKKAKIKKKLKMKQATCGIKIQGKIERIDEDQYLQYLLRED